MENIKPGYYLATYLNITGSVRVISTNTKQGTIFFRGPYTFKTGFNPYPLRAPISDLILICEISEQDYLNTILAT